jgi:poly-gamma-glutamate synthesis protein (capsule biosynthesis protein)
MDRSADPSARARKEEVLEVGFIGDVYLGHESRTPTITLEVQEVLERCDHIVANLEAPTTDVEDPIIKIGPALRQGGATIDLLRILRVNIVGLANNHIADHGLRGILETHEKLAAAGLTAAGAGEHMTQIYSPVRIHSKDVSVSILFGAENGFGCVCTQRTGEPGYAWLFHPAFLDLLKQEVQLSDFVVVVVHAGIEEMDRPLPQWRTVYRQLVDYGAAAIIAHHPHVTQGYEVYQGAPIFFSIGNFYFNMLERDPRWFQSQIPVLKFYKDKPVAFTVHHSTFSLLEHGSVSLDRLGSGPSRTALLTAELSSADYRSLVKVDLNYLWKTRYSPGINESVNAFTSLESVIQLIRRAARSQIRGTPFIDPMILEHYLEIESHRWGITETIRMMRSP